MTQKTISLNEKSYKLLSKLKKKNESYSELIMRLCALQDPSQYDPLLEFRGILRENGDLWKDIEKLIKQNRYEHLIDEIE